MSSRTEDWITAVARLTAENAQLREEVAELRKDHLACARILLEFYGISALALERKRIMACDVATRKAGGYFDARPELCAAIAKGAA